MTAPARRPCTKCRQNRQEKFYKSERGRVCLPCQKARSRGHAHADRIGRVYNLTAEQYALLLASQGGVCACCGQPRKYRLNVDHDHATGRVRGLLCRMCNGKLLTAARDNPATLRRAADYLENPPALAVIGEVLVPDEFKHGGAGRRRGRRRHSLASPQMSGPRTWSP